MAIKKDTTGKLFTLLTNNSMYQMKVDDLGFLVHTWFGKMCIRDSHDTVITVYIKRRVIIV